MTLWKIKIKWWYFILAYLLFTGLIILIEAIVASKIGL